MTQLNTSSRFKFASRNPSYVQTTKDLHHVDGSNQNINDMQNKVRPSTEGGRTRNRRSTIDPSSTADMTRQTDSVANQNKFLDEDVTVNTNKFVV